MSKESFERRECACCGKEVDWPCGYEGRKVRPRCSYCRRWCVVNSVPVTFKTVFRHKVQQRG